jgi:protein involved in polysaccharide export with SLBB domain
MKKALWIVGFVIILVYINWISDGLAQTTPDQLQSYQELLKQKQQPPGADPGVYQTPSLYDGAEVSAGDSLLARHRQTAGPIESNVPDNRTGQPSSDQRLVLPNKESVPRFGDNLFSNPQVGEINPAAVPEGYLLGPGDNVIISLWGRVDQEWNLTVDREGKVFIPKVGEITAWGLTLGQFADRLDAHLSKVYTGYERKVTLGKIRTIKVFVYGEVQAPGGYAVSALSTLFNCLYMAGGPTDRGSFRQIKLIRDQATAPIDLYDFLISGNKQCDQPLQSGDVIFVPLAGPQAVIRGEVRRPGVYELLGGEKVSDLMALAGGPTAEAYTGRLMLDRVDTNDTRTVVDLDFGGPEREDPLLADGDDLSVFSIYQRHDNIVWINGMIKHPGAFERTDSMRVADLIDQGQLLPSNVYRDRADLYRHLPDGRVEIVAVNLDSALAGNRQHDILLADLDSLQIYNTDDVERDRYVYIDGMVRNPGKFPLYEKMTVADLIFLAGNLKENAYTLEAELARIDSAGVTDLVRIPVTEMNDGRGVFLQENDHLFIRMIPGYELHRMVTIEGEVRFPGKYSLTHRNETLWELLNRAGGFTDKAFPIGTVFRRGGIIDDLQRKGIENIIETSQPLMADSTGLLMPLPALDIQPAGMDRIVIDMKTLMKTDGREGDFALQTGDQIYVPEIPTGISVLGEVCANGTIKYRPDKKVNYYLEQAGGFTRRADKGEVRLVKANGRVYSDDVQGRHVDLGDVIVIPPEIKKERDWLKYLTAGLSVLTGVATTMLLVDRL